MHQADILFSDSSQETHLFECKPGAEFASPLVDHTKGMVASLMVRSNMDKRRAWAACLVTLPSIASDHGASKSTLSNGSAARSYRDHLSPVTGLQQHMSRHHQMQKRETLHPSYTPRAYAKQPTVRETPLHSTPAAARERCQRRIPLRCSSSMGGQDGYRFIAGRNSSMYSHDPCSTSFIPDAVRAAPHRNTLS